MNTTATQATPPTPAKGFWMLNMGQGDIPHFEDRKDAQTIADHFTALGRKVTGPFFVPLTFFSTRS